MSQPLKPGGSGITGSRRKTAESILIYQHYDEVMDARSFREAVQIAHHDSGFMYATGFDGYFDDLAAAFRQKFPDCPCRACVRRRATPTQSC